MSDSTTKACRLCAAELPLSDFYLDQNGKPKVVCKTCHKERSKTWAKNNPDRMRKIKAACNQKHAEAYSERAREYRKRKYPEIRETMLAKARDWKAANKERHLANAREWYASNKARAKAASAAWTERNRDKVNARLREYKRSHPEKRREESIRRRARIKGAASGPVDYKAILARDGYICHICGGEVEPQQLQYDHVIPIARGGPHSMDNIRVAHAHCNRKKCAKLDYTPARTTASVAVQASP